MATASDQAFLDMESACLDTFGEVVIYTSPQGVESELVGIVSEVESMMDLSQSLVPVQTTETVLECRTSDLTSDPVVGATVEAGGVDYRVSRVSKSRDGVVKMVLVK
ncbi:MAG: hypothetical protein HQL97_01270 [Magnetococcales bacterium]|nr:hypothetical protein [Magnetococcales bacterium]